MNESNLILVGLHWLVIIVVYRMWKDADDERTSLQRRVWQLDGTLSPRKERS